MEILARERLLLTNGELRARGPSRPFTAIPPNCVRACVRACVRENLSLGAPARHALLSVLPRGRGDGREGNVEGGGGEGDGGLGVGRRNREGGLAE